MNILESIEKDRSKDNIWKVAYYILENPNKLEELWSIIEDGDSQMEMRASWALSKVVERDATKLDSLFNRMLNRLESTSNEGLRRNLLRSIYFSNLKKENFTVLFDLACKFVVDPCEPVAVRMFSMRIAHKIVLSVPELSSEFLQILESIEESITTSGLRSAYVNVISSIRIIASSLVR